MVCQYLFVLFFKNAFVHRVSRGIWAFGKKKLHQDCTLIFLLSVEVLKMDGSETEGVASQFIVDNIALLLFTCYPC